MMRIVRWLRALWRGWRRERPAALRRSEPINLGGGWSIDGAPAVRPTDARPRCSLCLLTGARYPLAEMLKRRRERLAGEAPRGAADV